MGDVSFRSRSVEGFKIISVFFHGYCSRLHPRQQCRSQWPHGLRRGSAAARLLGFRLRIPPGAWMSLVKRSPTECGVSECDRKASTMRRPWLTTGCCAMKKMYIIVNKRQYQGVQVCGCQIILGQLE